MLILDIKTKLYDILYNQLNYLTTDTAYSINENITFPCVRFGLETSSRDSFQDNFIYNYTFKIDIFSDYSGEKQIMQMEDDIYHKLSALYDVESVIYVREQNFRILDDDSTGVIRKHGVILIKITAAGIETEE